MAYPSMMSGTPLTPIEAAQAAVRGYCGWHVAPVVTETLTLDGHGDKRLLLPSLMVKEIFDVTVDGKLMDLADLEWSADGMLKLKSGYFPNKYRSVVVTLEHGFEPEEVSHIVQQIADRIILAPDAAAVFARVSTGDRSMDYRATAGSIGLLGLERDMLEPFKLRRTL
jgi:hypothetical protein